MTGLAFSPLLHNIFLFLHQSVTVRGIKYTVYNVARFFLLTFFIKKIFFFTPPPPPPKKYVIKCLIMLCIFVFTMGQLLRVHTGERTSAE